MARGRGAVAVRRVEADHQAGRRLTLDAGPTVTRDEALRRCSEPNFSNSAALGPLCLCAAARGLALRAAVYCRGGGICICVQTSCAPSFLNTPTPADHRPSPSEKPCVVFSRGACPPMGGTAHQPSRPPMAASMPCPAKHPCYCGPRRGRRASRKVCAGHEDTRPDRETPLASCRRARRALHR
eukprot:scaffold12300_cov132-Isochrysis_galbana.AAC.16